MGNELQKKYGLITAVCMVVGIVVGSGVFFKAEKILTATGGNLPLGILAWVIGGAIMIVCAYTFAVMATKYEKVNGIVDYAEATCGPRYGYTVGWFMALIYYPTLTGVLAWISARYTLVLFGSDEITGGACMTLACFYLVASYALNALSPVLAGKFQVTTTFIKLVPLLAMAVVGTIVGLANGLLIENFTSIPSSTEILGVNPDYAPASNALLTAVVATAFAYEGWIIATSINAELKNAKKNLPIALVLGTFIIMAVYILYYVGLAGAAENITMIAGGEAGAKIAFGNVFGTIGGTLIFVFVVISCIGTLNGLMLGCCRGLYSVAARGRGPKPVIFAQIDKSTNMPSNSSIVGLLLCGFWLLYFFGANLTGPWFGIFSFDTSELPIVTIYGLYIPIFINMMRKEKDLNVFQRIITPFLAICGSVFMIYAAFASHGTTAVCCYLVVFAVIIVIGQCFFKKKDTSEALEANEM
ncbi:MAG: APC family permease [Anaerovoracaceae bacterium]